MSSPSVLAFLSVLGVTLLSLLGIVFFLFGERFIRSILLYLVSFSTGALLGDVFLHMIPEMSEDTAAFPVAVVVILVGILFSFSVEKFVHWRHCHVLGDDHDHGHHHPVGILSLVGEGVHNFIDGVVIAASFLAGIPVGIATTLAIVFHEIPHEIGNYAILLHSGFSRGKALLFNLLSGCLGFAGLALVLSLSSSASSVAAYLLPFAAGNLLYIAGSDLIPELHKHSKPAQSFLQLLLMIVGMAFMYAVLLFE